MSRGCAVMVMTTEKGLLQFNIQAHVSNLKQVNLFNCLETVKTLERRCALGIRAKPAMVKVFFLMS